jgi:hypothetical protein
MIVYFPSENNKGRSRALTLEREFTILAGEFQSKIRLSARTCSSGGVPAGEKQLAR